MRIRLKERMFFMGRMHQPGEIIDLPDGMKGPHKSERVSHDRIDYNIDPAIDANRMPGELKDVPLFDVLPDETNPGEEL